jgi:hypothetical protein
MATEAPESSDAAGSEFDWLTLDDGEQVQWSGKPHVYSIVPALIVGLSLSLFLIGIPIVVGAYLNRENTVYLLTNEALYRKSGVLSRDVQKIEFEKVQNSSYSQGRWGTTSATAPSTSPRPVAPVSRCSSGPSPTRRRSSNESTNRAAGRGGRAVARTATTRARTQSRYSTTSAPSCARCGVPSRPTVATGPPMTPRRARMVGETDGFGGGIGATGERSLPGTTEQWAAVREEVVALRRAVERRRRSQRFSRW